jgi:hypothetical protein
MLDTIQTISDYRHIIMPVLLILAVAAVVVVIRDLWRGDNNANHHI